MSGASIEGVDMNGVDCVELLAELVAIPSTFPPGDTSAICRHIATRLEGWGYRVEIASRVAGVDNVIARIGTPAVDGRADVVFNSHIDTVGIGHGWETAPLVLSAVPPQRLAGLGAANCKGSAATHLWLAQMLAQRGGPQRGEVVFTFVGDEENLGPHGTRFLAQEGLVRPRLLILGAPTANQLVVRERGVMWVRIAALGKGAHAGQPEAGDNAVLRLMRLLQHLQQQLGTRLASRRAGTLASTLNIGTIEGGDNTNVVPAQASATLDRRLLPVSESVAGAYDEIVQLLAAAGEPEASYRSELLTGTDGFSAQVDGPLVQAFQHSVAALGASELAIIEAIGASDGRYFAGTDTEIINFGPGEGSQGHAPNESVAVAELRQACRILAGVLERLSGFRDASGA
jgi:acetylornithine deacetylase/succinyl-diaminopimelate desuccinylase-like protein